MRNRRHPSRHPRDARRTTLQILPFDAICPILKSGKKQFLEI